MTSIASDPGSAQTFIASFANGSVKVFDRRLDEDDAIVRTYSQHTTWVQNARWHPTLNGQLLSARYAFSHRLKFRLLRLYISLDGEVKLWDLRGSDDAVKTWELHANGLSAFDVHPLAGVFAS